MGFSAKQVQALRRSLSPRQVRTREANGRELSYIEGWFAISEANRIFGFDGWSRRPSNHAASWPAKIAVRSSPSTSPACASRCTPERQLSFAKVMAQARGGAIPPVRCTTFH